MRLCSEHHEVIINFAEKHPQIITNKFVGLSANNKAKNLWEQLTNMLNALGYGNLSINDYKRRLTDWKSKSKAKAAEIEKSLNSTGGGQATTTILTHHEKRLLALMGNKAFRGDEEVGEIGLSSNSYNSMHLQKKAKIAVDMPESQKTDKIPYNLLPPDNPISENLDLNTEIDEGHTENILIDYTEDHNYSAEETSCQQKDKTVNKENKKGKSVSTIRRRKVTNLSEDIRKLNDQSLSVLHQIDSNLVNMNNNLSSIHDTFNRLTDAVIKFIDHIE